MPYIESMSFGVAFLDCIHRRCCIDAVLFVLPSLDISGSIKGNWGNTQRRGPRRCEPVRRVLARPHQACSRGLTKRGIDEKLYRPSRREDPKCYIRTYPKSSALGVISPSTIMNSNTHHWFRCNLGLKLRCTKETVHWRQYHNRRTRRKPPCFAKPYRHFSTKSSREPSGAPWRRGRVATVVGPCLPTSVLWTLTLSWMAFSTNVRPSNPIFSGFSQLNPIWWILSFKIAIFIQIIMLA